MRWKWTSGNWTSGRFKLKIAPPIRAGSSLEWGGIPVALWGKLRQPKSHQKVLTRRQPRRQGRITKVALRARISRQSRRPRSQQSNQWWPGPGTKRPNVARGEWATPSVNRTAINTTYSSAVNNRLARKINISKRYPTHVGSASTWLVELVVRNAKNSARATRDVADRN